MLREALDHNANRIKSLVESGASFSSEQPIETSFYQLLTSGKCDIEQVIDAYVLYLATEERHIMDALIIAKASDINIAEALSMSQPMISAYRYLFCDRTVFRHDLEIRQYVRTLKVLPQHKLFYDEAFLKGYKYFADRFRIGEKPTLSPKQVIEQIMLDASDRAIAHRGEVITSEIAKEALRWASAAVSSAQALIRVGAESKNISDDLRLALRIEDHTTTVEDLGIEPGQMVH
jgi:hypothetical protein